MLAASEFQPDHKVRKWLETIPEGRTDVCLTLDDVDLNLDPTDASNNTKSLSCDEDHPLQNPEKNSDFPDSCEVSVHSGNENKDSVMYLQGCPCDLHLNRSKTDISEGKKDRSPNVRRVTFRFSEDTIDVGCLKDIQITPAQAKATKALEDDRSALRRGMHEYLAEIARKRDQNLGTRQLVYLPDETTDTLAEDGEREIDDRCGWVNDEDRISEVGDRRERHDGPETFYDIICVGRSERGIPSWTELKRPTPHPVEAQQEMTHRVRLPPWGSKPTPMSNRTKVSRRVLQKPAIKGLVVDSAANQQPSIVRASKNANIREEFALKTRIDGYVSECCHNIKNIRIAQRKLTTNLAFLKNKMAATSAARAEQARYEATNRRLETPILYSQKTFPLVFPPLVYKSRRVLTVS